MQQQRSERIIAAVTRTALLAILASTWFGHPGPSEAQEDITPPVLRGFRFTPKSFDVGKQPQTMEVTFIATDDLSGVAHIQCVFASPWRQQTIVADVGKN